MTRDHEYVGTRATPRPGGHSTAPPITYPVRHLIAYHRLIERRERVDPAVAVAEYARAHPDIDLDARRTFADWHLGSLLEDTAERPGGFFR